MKGKFYTGRFSEIAFAALMGIFLSVVSVGADAIISFPEHHFQVKRAICKPNSDLVVTTRMPFD